jgi:sortase B
VVTRVRGKRLEEKEPTPKKKKLLLWAALAVCICVMAGAGFYLGQYYYHFFMQENERKNINDLFESVRPNAVGSNPSPTSTPDDGIVAPPWDGDETPPGEDGEEETERQRERRYLQELVRQNREVYAEILAINNDWLGQISIPGLIDPQPYVRSWDNDEYMHTSFEGRRSPMGTVFLHSDNDSLLMDYNSVMYGHNVKAGAMFAKLLDYKQASAFQRAPVVVLDGLTGESVWIVFAAYVTEPFWEYERPIKQSDEFADLLAEILARSWFVTDVDVNDDDRILTLVTCDYTHDDMRFAVHARKLRPGEEIPEAVAAAENPDRKPYNIPSEQRLSEITANRAAVMLHPTSNRIYFYQPRDGGIDRYSGNTSVVQGLYSSYTGRVSGNSFLSAVYYPDPDRQSDKRRLYVAADNFNRQRGIFLLSNRLATGNLEYHGLVTPHGVDAKFPALVHDGGEVWLLYAVAHDGGEDVYRRLIRDRAAHGEPELLLSVPAGTGVRPLGYYTIDGVPLLFWHEASNKAVRGAWEGGDAFTVQLTGDANRVTLYGTARSGRIRAAVERNGRFTFSNIELANIPQPPAQTVAAPEPEPDPGPDGGQEEAPGLPEPPETDGDDGGEGSADEPAE